MSHNNKQERDDDMTNYFDGEIAFACAWDRALTAEEVKEQHDLLGQAQ